MIMRFLRTPPAFWLTTLSLRLRTASRLTRTSPTEMPNSSAWRACSAISADSSMLFVGIQPRRRQVPPRRASFSTMATFIPSWLARTAAT